MSVRNWSGFGVAIAVCAIVSQAALAAGGRPSRQALEQMGLGGMVVMSDEEAMSVRGQGFQNGGSSVQVSGSSFATIDGPNGGAHSENAYAASGKHFAKGKNFSFAGVINVSSDGHNDKGKDRGGNHGNHPNGNNNWDSHGGMNGGPWGGMDGGSWGGMDSGPWHNQPGGDMGGGHWGGKPGGHRGGKVTIHATIVFAGGSSSAWAF